MKVDCTERFVQFREIARLTWNLGFWPWPEPTISELNRLFAYEEAMARLFEGMILLPLGHEQRVTGWPQGLGEVARVDVVIDRHGAKLRAFREAPGEAGLPPPEDFLVRPEPGTAEGRFLCFHDQSQLEARDYRYVVIQITRLDENPVLIGREALVEFRHCKFWGEQDDSD
jgi:hypothetical protein